MSKKAFDQPDHGGPERGACVRARRAEGREASCADGDRSGTCGGGALGGEPSSLSISRSPAMKRRNLASVVDGRAPPMKSSL
jgi:hypothetical protein